MKGGLILINSHKVKTRMFELGKKQDEIAKELDIDPSTLSDKVNNKRRFYIDEVARLSKILGISTRQELKDYFGLDFLIFDQKSQK